MDTSSQSTSEFEQNDNNVDVIDKTQEIEEFEVYNNII